MSDVDDRSDRTLVHDCLQGNHRSFDVLVDRYYRKLYGVALRITGCREEAQDVTQTAFLKVYEKLDTYDPDHKFFSWLYRILMNEGLNQVKKRRSTVELDEALLSRGSTPEQDYERRRMHDVVQEALMHLPVEQREVLVLRHFGDLSYEEISHVIGVPEKTVKSRLFSARRRLSAILVEGRSAP
jgi:RNA polymerase sigma-70 factor (ECF subfamily)